MIRVWRGEIAISSQKRQKAGVRRRLPPPYFCLLTKKLTPYTFYATPSTLFNIKCFFNRFQVFQVYIFTQCQSGCINQHHFGSYTLPGSINRVAG